MSIGSSSSRSETAYEAHTYNGGSIASEGIITLAAKSADDIKGNIKAIGQSITGQDVNLIASRDVSLEAGKNSSQQRENYTSKGWSLGANVGVNGSGIIGANAGINKAKQTGDTDVTTHTGTTVTATNTAAITSGHDTTLVGSKAIGEQVTANVGGNLSIISVQDEKTYTGTSSNQGLSISTTGGSIGKVSFANHKGSMNSTYKSVTEQAGLYAGDKGFSIDTKGTTSLVGAVIHSDADAAKNTLTTGSLTTESIHNTAEYTSRNTGVSYTHRGDFKHLSQAGKDAVWNTLGLLPVLQPNATDDAQSTTTSAIANGTIKVTDSSANLDQLSRDTANSLNKLDEIFDKKKVEERQELSRLFAKEAFAQLHNWNPTSPEGKAAKAIAHGIVAETSARIAGNKAGSGFYAGATNEALIGEIQKLAKDNPAVAQWLSASIGAAVNAGMGNSAATGATVAQYGTKWNNLWDNDITEGQFLTYNDALYAMNANIELEYAKSEYNPEYITNAQEYLEARYYNMVMQIGQSAAQLTDNLELAGKFLEISLKNGGDQVFKLGSLAANKLHTNPAFISAVRNLGASIPVGETHAYYTSIAASDGEKYAFGHLKLAINITHNYDGTYSVNGLAGDVYNYEKHRIKELGDYINNMAYELQRIGLLKPFVYHIEISTRI